ncbi:acyl-CoA desaturase [Zavarzinella formosa]|uniref:acyl-CoA desaturase n=1 Tax=Zavarzinella formosa TaxID=360055 RepID=UPI0002DCBC65|nr:fatty acid desaturase [Zavarzinella formosa]
MVANQRMIVLVFLFHSLALLACIPWLFSWWGVGLWLGGHYLYGTLGMTMGYHRLLTHRGFTCPRWFEHALAVLGVCCLEGTPMSWVAVHRMHHQHSDQVADPHSPRLKGFLWSHMGWFMFLNPNLYKVSTYERYIRDLFQDRFYKRMEKPWASRRIYIIQWLVYLVLGALVGLLTDGSAEGILQMSLSFLVWGVILRTVTVWHVTWSVNSITHIWGYRNYVTRDQSRNNWVVALVSGGEGWHNNHHAEPRAASHGQRWWEFDHTYTSIRLFQMVGLASNVVKPKRRMEMEQPQEEAVAS